MDGYHFGDPSMRELRERLLKREGGARPSSSDIRVQETLCPMPNGRNHVPSMYTYIVYILCTYGRGRRGRMFLLLPPLCCQT